MNKIMWYGIEHRQYAGEWHHWTFDISTLKDLHGEYPTRDNCR